MTHLLHPALAGLHDVDWAALSAAYGSAADVPRLLAGTTSDDPETVREAVFGLLGTVCHQGTVYEATPYAVPFLTSLAESGGLLERGSHPYLLWTIAASTDSSAEVLSRIREALADQAPRLLALAADPDRKVRLFATLTVGFLEGADPGAVGEALADRLRHEEDPEVTAALITTRVRVAPGDCSWLSGWEGTGQPGEVRAAALWARARSPLPWSDEYSQAVAGVWAGGDPGGRWEWAGEQLTDLVRSLYQDRPATAVDLLRLLVDGPPGGAAAALFVAHRLCELSRSARTEVATVLAAGLGHPDPGTRGHALPLVADVAEAAVLAADELAELIRTAAPQGGLSPGRSLVELPVAAPPAWYAVLALLRIDDPRWLDPVLRTLEIGPVPILPEMANPVRDLSHSLDPDRFAELLSALRRRLAGLTGPGADLPVDAVDLYALLVAWGERSRPALPELLALVRLVSARYDDDLPPTSFTRPAAELGTDLPELTAALREHLAAYAEQPGDTGALFAAAEADVSRGRFDWRTEEYLDELGPAAGPLLPALRRLRDGDTPIPRFSVIDSWDGVGAVTGDRDAVALLDSFITRISGEDLP